MVEIDNIMQLKNIINEDNFLNKYEINKLIIFLIDIIKTVYI